MLRLTRAISLAIVFGVMTSEQAVAGGIDGGTGADATQDAQGNPTVVAFSELDRPDLPGRRATGVVTCAWFEPSESTQFDA
ncbi:MAG: hypothetical protein ACRDX9_05110, partial [Acidimicrobiia bacterium]